MTCSSKVSADVVNARRHRGLKTYPIEHTLCQRSKIGQDFELRNLHIVISKSAHDLIQISTLNIQ